MLRAEHRHIVPKAVEYSTIIPKGEDGHYIIVAILLNSEYNIQLRVNELLQDFTCDKISINSLKIASDKLDIHFRS